MRKGLLFLIIFAFSFCLLSCGKDSEHSASSKWENDDYYHWHSCTDCSEVFDKELHTWDDGVVTKPATEELDGEKTYTCTVCSATKVEVIYALGHVHEFSNEYSHDELFHWFASTCGHNDEVGNKELHEYEFKQLTAATCTEDEVLIGTCVCGDTMIKVGELTKGHQVDNYVSNNDATCLANGTKTGDCTVCGDVCTVIDEGSMLEHSWEEKTVAATYESSGETYRECKNDYCKTKETIEVYPKLISVNEVELSGSSFMAVNSTQSLVANVFPLDAHDKTLSWRSSDESVATVDANGEVSSLKTGRTTITAVSHNGIERTVEILVLETAIDGSSNGYYDGVVPFSGRRTDPVLKHESYVKLGEDGIYIYQLVEDGSGKTGTAHVEWYFTLGDDAVLDGSLSVHVYYASAPNIRTYTYSSSTNVSRNDNLGAQFCDYSVKSLGEENGLAIYAYEIFVDYSYFGLTVTPETIKAQVRTVSGGGNPLINSIATSGLDYKDINNYEEYSEKGYVSEIVVDGKKDENYSGLVPFSGSRVGPVVTHESYVKLGEEGIYVYQIVTDGSGKTEKAHVEWYFTLGEEVVLDDSLSVHIYYETAPNIRTYTYSSTTNTSRNDNLASAYCNYAVELISENNGLATYAYELFVDYDYFGLTETPESIKAQVRVISGGGNPLINSNATSGLDYKEIESYETYDGNGYHSNEVNDGVVIDGIKDDQYNSITPLIGKRTDPIVTQDVYVYFGEGGIYAYQLVTDGSGKTENAHVEWYFTLGDTTVADDSLSIHLYYEKEPHIRSYKYSSTSNVSRDDNIAKNYCDYSIKLISNEGGISVYAYELFVDYSYFKTTTTPESMNIQVRASSGGNNPLTNSVHAGGLDYKVIDNYYTFDEKGFVYSSVGTQDLQLDPTNIVSGYYETEFTLQTLNTLNKLSNATFTGVGSEYIKEVGNGRYKLSIPVDKVADFMEKQKITVVDTRNIGATFTIQILEEEKQEFKLLMIGNSFSDDTIQWVNEICADLGIEFTIANLYIGGASLATHSSNLSSNASSYTYREYDKINKIWVSHSNVSISEALTFDDWNYISLQQGSAVSGKAETYDDIDKIIDKILTIKDNVKFIWNMTWAYQQDSTHSSFVNYDSNQETMYNAIVNAVETKVLTNDRIALISPAGTSIQNARTSFVGDTLTRDGHHLSYELGRYIAGLTLVGTLTGTDLTKVKYSPNLADKYRDMAIESAINAINNPLAVTNSTYTEDVEEEHNWVTKVVESTCLSEGERYQECSICGEKEVLEVLPKIPLETTIDGEKDSFYDEVDSYSGKRTNPTVTHETYIRLGEKGIYVYQIIEDGKGLVSTKSHVELYFTLGQDTVVDNSLSIHIYPAHTDAIRSYTYTSTTNVARNDNLAKTYCTHSTKIITDETGYGKYVVELFIDYSYFGLTEAPESIKTQVRVISGGGNPLTNNTAGGLDYKLIENYYTFGKNGLVTTSN